jgi:hypothetical protein
MILLGFSETWAAKLMAWWGAQLIRYEFLMLRSKRPRQLVAQRIGKKLGG